MKQDKKAITAAGAVSTGRGQKIHRGRERLRSLVLVALMAAFISVSAQVAIPLPVGVPVTLQTLAVAVCGYLLGVKRSLFTVVLYNFMGFVGLPVFASFQGGAAALLGKTGGFLFGFLFMAAMCALLSPKKPMLLRILLGAVGVLILHGFGALWFARLTDCGFWHAVTLVSLPYLAKDMISVALAAVIACRLRPIVDKRSV